MEHSECLRVLGLVSEGDASKLLAGDVHSAFRRVARRCHPDAFRARGSGSMSPLSDAEFKNLVCARDILLLDISAGKRPQTRVGASSMGAFDVWLLFSRVGVPGLVGYVERLIMSDRAYHGIFVRMAAILGDEAFTRRVYSLVSSYYSERVHVVHLTASLRDMLDGLVRMWCDAVRGTKLFIPLWHSSLLYEDYETYFVIGSDMLIVGDSLCDYVVVSDDLKERVIVRSISYVIFPESNDLSLHVELEGCSRSDGFYLRLVEGKEVWVDIDACIRVPQEYLGCGLYRVNDDDVFDVSERADVRVTLGAKGLCPNTQ